MPPADNARFLVEASKARSRQARERAEEAIKTAARRSERPTVVGIANAAGVSRSWLYTQTDLITAINQLQQRAPAPHRNPRHAASDVSLHRWRPHSNATGNSATKSLTSPGNWRPPTGRSAASAPWPRTSCRSRAEVRSRACWRQRSSRLRRCAHEL
ncbi:DUF6262 family protein [Streptomyces zhihengii]